VRNIIFRAICATVFLSGCAEIPDRDLRASPSPTMSANSKMQIENEIPPHPEFYMEVGRSVAVDELLLIYSRIDLERWSSSGDQIAMYLLGKSFERSLDNVRARSYYEEAAKEVGVCVVAPVSKNTCRLNLRAGDLSCPCGLPEAQFEVALSVLAEGEEGEAVAYLRKAYLGGSRQAGELLLTIESRAH